MIHDTPASLSPGATLGGNILLRLGAIYVRGKLSFSPAGGGDRGGCPLCQGATQQT